MARMRARHGGNLREFSDISGRSCDQILDFSANMNPLGPPDWLRSVINRSIEMISHYPDPEYSLLVNESARHFGVPGDEILVGNGSSELLFALMASFENKKRVLVPVPSYVDYARAAHDAGLEVEEIALEESRQFVFDPLAIRELIDSDTVVILGQPNNPTGKIIEPQIVRELARDYPECELVVDEAFADFVLGYESLIYNRPRNVSVLYSMTKFFAIAGLRLGLAFARSELARRVRERLIPWSVNVVAEQVGMHALRDRNYYENTRETVKRLRGALESALVDIPGLVVYPGQANFLLVKIGSGSKTSEWLAKQLLQEGIAIRTCHNYSGLTDRHFRVAVRTEEENQRLIEALKSCLSTRIVVKKPARQKAALMFQATGSNAGKSILTAALCRILLQDGYRVAPFKAQNMSLNSFVTEDGKEMGRAQVLQAEACRLKPDVRMNPILLKPNSDTGSQVIVMGKPYANLSAKNYHAYQKEAFEEVKKAFFSLSNDFEVMVLEGAGSCGEINLKKHDIVNMKMAKLAGCPVLIAGDIDRGGVFASFIGHMNVLAEWERKLVAGFVINRFRGDADLLTPATRYLEDYTGKPSLGVVPYIDELGLPEEDSVSFKQSRRDVRSSRTDAVSIVVISLPHISNFTDIDPLCLEPDVNLSVVAKAKDLGQPDLLIIPGTKNVIGDLAWLESTGLAQGIVDLYRHSGTRIVGICGGFQMLGSTIRDPFSIESDSGEVKGLGLLDLDTVLEKEKTLKQVRAWHVSSGREIRGYEIHHGQTEIKHNIPAIKGDNDQILGVNTPNGKILGTYLHGLFDKDAFRRWFLDDLRKYKGFDPLEKPQVVYDVDPALDRLADVVRNSLDIQAIKRLMGLA